MTSHRAAKITERVLAELRVLYATSEVLHIGDRENVQHPVERAVRLAVPLALGFADECKAEGDRHKAGVKGV
jgi:hypothetical protein